MISKFRKPIFGFILISLLAFASADNPIEKIIAGFQQYLENLPQEKVYLHFDRPYYASGETMWFNAYLTAGEFHKPSKLSHTIYVDLLNEKEQLVQQLKLFSSEGSAAGDFILSDSLPSGNYLVRAYTQWMRNSGEEYFFYQPIKIWNKEAPAASLTPNEELMDISFYPEGGDLVNGILSKLAFKAIGPDGYGREIEGKIVDGSGAEIYKFKSNTLGMGAFPFTPEKNKEYYAVIKDVPGKFKLPTAKSKGLVMGIQNSSRLEDLILGIKTNRDHLESLYILGQTRGIVAYAAHLDLSSNQLVARIPKAKFPAGVAQITVLDQNGNPLAERLVYINKKEDHLSVKVTPDKKVYAPRELVTLNIKAEDTGGNPVVADLSLSVTDDQQVLIDENRETITSYLLLTSELRGHIESPGYYFNPENQDREEALDYLLLTQGWRRFTIKEALATELSQPEYNVEKGLTIKGKLLNKYNDKPIADGKVTYLSYFPIADTKEVITSSTGDFQLHPVYFFDSPQAVIKGVTKKGGKRTKVVIDSSPDLPEITFPIYPLKGTQNNFEKQFIAKSIERKKINEAYKFDAETLMLDEISIDAKKEDEQNHMRSAYGKGSVTVKVSDDPTLSTMRHPLQLIQGRVPGVQVNGGGQNWEVIIGGVGSILAGIQPLILVDDMPVPMESLNSLSVQDIASYTVWKGARAATFGSRGANGAIGFYTKSGQGIMDPIEGLYAYENKGYHIAREFYSPKYDVKKPEDIKPDKRATLFWAPNVKTDFTGHAKVTFYNHDLETTVTGVVNGLSSDGLPGANIVKYEIDKK